MFHVELHVGENEVFRGSGRSIRKAQHAAAAAALTGTTFASAPKARKESSRKNQNTTPTVELNVLAMKRGLTVRYDVEDPQTIFPFPFAKFDAALLYDYRHNPHQRHHFQKTPYTAVLHVDDQVFRGSGMTPQGARHDAAHEALRVLRPLNSVTTDPPVTDIKSPISVVHEMAAKMGFTVTFGLISESGPTHLPNFVMKCTVSVYETQGQGNSKKVAKKNAAAQMVQTLSALSQFNDVSVGASDKSVEGLKHVEEQQKHGEGHDGEEDDDAKQEQDDAGVSESAVVTLQPVRELISPSTSISEDDKEHPVHPVNQLSRLVRLHRKEEPGYLVIYERCIDKKRKEFVVECCVRERGAGMLTAVGVDAHRKVAKKKAAESMIQLILTGRSSPEIHLPPKPPHPPILKQSVSREDGRVKGRERKVSFTDKTSSGNKRAIVDKAEIGKHKSNKSSRNIAPGVLVLQGKKDDPVDKGDKTTGMSVLKMHF
jgi:double-stranded RNA-binding protein Staufen